MNLIIICSDTFRADYLGCYGNDWIETPYLDQLASEGILFLDCFAEGLPTIPARRTLMTGRRVLPFYLHPQKSDGVRLPGWHPLFYEDITLSEVLQGHNYTNAFITDVYHMMKPGKNFHRGFHCWRWIRGQEADRYVSGPKEGVLERYLGEERRGWILQYFMNREEWKSEEDYFVAQVMREAANWLDANVKNQPFFMWIDCFDPHEPWDPPKSYANKYCPDYDEPTLIIPPGRTDGLSDEQFERVKALYAGEVTLVDRWVGHLLNRIKALNLLDETIVVFTSDHGTMMGEQGEIHKGPARLRHQCTRVPLIIRHPDTSYAGKRISGFVQHHDLMPTLLDLLSVDAPERVQGENFWQMVTDGKAGVRDTVISAFGYYASVRTKDWNYVAPWTVQGQNMQAPQLYNLNFDPNELTNVIDEHPDIAQKLQEALDAYMKGETPLTKGTLDVSESPPLDDQSKL